MATVKEAILRLESHEAQCLERMKSIERRLDEGSTRFNRAEAMIISLYPFIVVAVVLERML
jgi:hypothetical protein